MSSTQSIVASNVTSGFIDLATFDELEKYMYGGQDATAYFVRETRKSTWFTQVPVVLSRSTGNPGFGNSWSVNISRAGDYLLDTWLRVTFPKIQLNANFLKYADRDKTLWTSSSLSSYLPSNWATEYATDTSLAPTFVVAWTKNLMHNLISECAITFNDLVAARFDNYHLDFWHAFTMPKGKQIGYENMIGNTGDMTNGIGPHFPLPSTDSSNAVANVMTHQTNSGYDGHNSLWCLPEKTLNLPLPFFFTRDTGVALPTAALPYNEMRINFVFRSLTDLLFGAIAWYRDGADPAVGSNNGLARAHSEYGNSVEQSTAWTTGSLTIASGTNVTSLIDSANVDLSNVQVWANYAIVSNSERRKMACRPRDILIEQVQSTSPLTFNPSTSTNPYFDVRFSHAIKVLFFAVRNSTHSSVWSNYTCGSPYYVSNVGVQYAVPKGFEDPLATCSLIYENTARLSNMGQDYYSLVAPYYSAPVIPESTGFHMYSYSLDFHNLDPMGSTNYGKLTNVTVAPAASAAAIAASTGVYDSTVDNQSHYSSLSVMSIPYARSYPQSFTFVLTAINNNIIRISGGKSQKCASNSQLPIKLQHYLNRENSVKCCAISA